MEAQAKKYVYKKTTRRIEPQAKEKKNQLQNISYMLQVAGGWRQMPGKEQWLQVCEMKVRAGGWEYPNLN